jgi:hypothetical protein
VDLPTSSLLTELQQLHRRSATEAWGWRRCEVEEANRGMKHPLEFIFLDQYLFHCREPK